MSRRASVHVAAVALTSLALIIATALIVDLDHFYFRGLARVLNDQLGYVSVARHLAEHGRLESSIVYPSTLAQNAAKGYLYLPGHYLALAAAYKLFGYSVANSFLPAIFGYLLTSVLVFVVAARFYGRSAAWMAFLLFALFPPNLILAFTAMSEMTITAACFVAVAVFVFLPERLKPWLGPLLLIPAIFCRETAAVILLVFASLVQWPRRAATLLAIGCVVVLLATQTSAWKSRPSLFLNNLVSDDFATIYSDAHAVDGVSRSPAALMHLAVTKAARNIQSLAEPWTSKYRPDAGECIALFAMLVVIPIAAMRARRDALAFGVAAAAAGVVFLLLVFYTFWGFRGVRNLLFLQPLMAVVVAGAIAALPRARVASTNILFLMAIYALAYVRSIYEPEAFLTVAGERDRAFIEATRHDDRTMIVSPDWISAEYVSAHFPVRWSFVPANLATLQLLERRYEVGTIIVPLVDERTRSAMGMLSVEELRADGWMPVVQAEREGLRFLVLRKEKGPRVSPRAF